MRFNLRVVLVSLVALVAAGVFLPGLGSKTWFAPSVAGGGEKFATLVIDYGSASGLPVQSFDLDALSPTTKGWDLFEAAGLQVQGTDQFPSGFVCRINDWPTKETQDCADTPSFQEGHWAYYVTNARMGYGWLLSGQGAAAHEPDCAGYEGWSWVGAGQEAQPPRFQTLMRGCQ